MGSIFDIIELIGGLGVFLYGMHVMSDGIQRRAGEKMRRVLAVFTNNRFGGVLTGLGVTSLLQSSSATTVLLVSIVNAGLMSLEQSIGVIMGANIGTTLTGWIVSIFGFKFSITALALPAVAVGLPLFFSKSEKRRELASMLIGFGILFLGLHIMKESVPDLRNNPEILEFLKHFAEVNIFSEILFVLIGTLLTICVQSSSAAMAITITMAFNGWISFPIAACIVLGENIGTTITAYLASLGMNVNARRAARAHMLFNVIGVAWMLIVFKLFIGLIDNIIPGAITDPENIPIHLSAFHTLFNITNTLLLIGFVPAIARLTRRWIPDEEEKPHSYLKFIHTHTTEDVESNLISVQSELSRMAEMVYEMSLWDLSALEEDEAKISETQKKITAFEKETDQIQGNIGLFLTSCMTRGVSENQARRIRAMYRMAHELENIGDNCRNIVRLLSRRAKKSWDFHESGIDDLADYHGHVLDFLRYISDALGNKIDHFSLAIARDMESKINTQRKRLKKIARKMIAGGADIKGEMAFLDLSRYLEQIGDACFNVAEEITAINIESDEDDD